MTPYNTDRWNDLLILLNIAHKYPKLIDQLIHGFHVWAPAITHSFIPPNNPSISIHHNMFNKMLQKEFAKQQYIGPFSQDALEPLNWAVSVISAEYHTPAGKTRKVPSHPKPILPQLSLT